MVRRFLDRKVLERALEMSSSARCVHSLCSPRCVSRCAFWWLSRWLTWCVYSMTLDAIHNEQSPKFSIWEVKFQDASKRHCWTGALQFSSLFCFPRFVYIQINLARFFGDNFLLFCCRQWMEMNGDAGDATDSRWWHSLKILETL